MKVVFLNEQYTKPLKDKEYVIGPINVLKILRDSGMSFDANRHGRISASFIGRVMNIVGMYLQSNDIYSARGKPDLYDGLQFSSEQDLNSKLVKLLQDEFDSFTYQYYAHFFKNRPINTETLYIVLDDNIDKNTMRKAIQQLGLSMETVVETSEKKKPNVKTVI